MNAFEERERNFLELEKKLMEKETNKGYWDLDTSQEEVSRIWNWMFSSKFIDSVHNIKKCPNNQDSTLPFQYVSY